MTYTVNSRWDSRASGRVSDVLAYARQQGAARLDFLEEMVAELYRLGEQVELNADLEAAHSAHECGDPETGAAWRSRIWHERGNPSGIGVTDAQDFGYGYETGADAARAHTVRMHAYVHGPIRSGSVLKPYIPLGHRYDLILAGPKAGKVKTIAQMTGGWWTDPQGHEKVARRARDMFPDGGDPMAEQIVFGRVPEPGNMVDDFVNKPEGRGWRNYGTRTLRGVVLHAVKGYASTTGTYFRTWDDRYDDGGHGYNALTDWGVCGEIDVRAKGSAAWDGRIMNWNDPDGRGRFRSPYASGGDGSKGISGDAIAFVNTYGTIAINRDTEAIELSLLQNTDPVSPKMLASTIALAAWRVDMKGRVPYTHWPRNNDGLHMIFSHYEFGKSICHIPDGVFAAVIDGVGATLKRWQVVGVPEEPATQDPLYPPGMTPELAAALWDGPDGPLKKSWASRPFTFDPDRAECRFWLERGKARLKPGERWDSENASFPPLINVIRRHKDKSAHAYVWSSGPAFEKRVR